MKRLTNQFGYPWQRGSIFRLQGRRYRIGQRGAKTLELLSTLQQAHSSASDGGWALPLCEKIKAVQILDARSVLTLVVDRTDDPALRRLAIWLRGRCGGMLGTATLARFATDPDRSTRKELARALKRMRGWSTLHQMASDDPDSRIRQLATARPPRPYHDRLTEFILQTGPHAVSPGRMSLVVAPDVDWNEPNPPKSPAAIGRILRRIHQLFVLSTR